MSKMTIAKAPFRLHEWRFVRPDFLGWADRAPWTRIVPVAGNTAREVPETPDGAEYGMNTRYVEWMADYLEDMVRTLRDVGRPDEARKWQDTTRSPERSLLIRTNVTDRPLRSEVGMIFFTNTETAERGNTEATS